MLQNHLRNISLYRVIKFLSSSRKTHIRKIPFFQPFQPFPASFRMLSALLSRQIDASCFGSSRGSWGATPWGSNDHRWSPSLFSAIGTWCSAVGLRRQRSSHGGAPCGLSLSLVGEAAWTWQCLPCCKQTKKNIKPVMKKCLREKTHQSLLLDVAPNLVNVGTCWKMEAEVVLMAIVPPVGRWQVFQSFSKTYSGWWLGHPSEKYERQLGWLATQYMGK